MREPMRGRHATYKTSREDRRMLTSWETPEKMKDNALKKRLCGSDCGKCEVLCGFGREWLERKKCRGNMEKGNR